MIRYMGVATLSLALAGCDMIGAAFATRSEKVNAAFPLPEELITAQNILFGSTQDAKSTPTPLKTQYAQLLDVRALSCSSAVLLSRFDTPADIKQKISDTTCFREQNAKLIEWVGMQRAILALQKPALVPFAALPARTVVASPGEPTVGVIVAADANVAILKGNQSKLTAIQLPSGKVINAFTGPEQAYRQGMLSPNGRVLAMPVSNNALKFLDVESGSTLWSTDKYTDVTAWLPAVDATLLAQKGNGAPMLLDHRSAAFEAYPVAISRLTWAVPIGGGETRQAVGDNYNAALLEHSRGADGTLKVNAIKQWRLAPPGVTSSAPLSMANGKKLVYVAMRDLAWLDLESGAQGAWNVGAIGAHGFSKVSETGIYLDTASGPAARTARLLDIEQATIAGVQGGEPNEGLLMPLTPRQGYIRRGSSATVIGSTAVAEGEAQPLEKVLSEANLAQQLAKLNSESFEGRPQPGTAAAVNAAAAGHASLPGAGSAGGRLAAPGIPPDAQVSVIGVYEPNRGATRTPGNRIAHPIDVNVAPSKIPLVLALSSYEPVQWRIRSNGRPIAAVLLSSYYPSTVTGVQGNVIVIGQQYAYKIDSPEYARLKASIARYAPNPVRLFQGAYTGSSFMVPAN